MNVLAFAASTSKSSINKQLVTFACTLNSNHQYHVVDLNDYELPLFSVDLEEEIGQPENAKKFHNEISQHDAIIISFAEHNGSYAAGFKNLFDWLSRIERHFFQNKPVFALATSPGPGGAKNVLATAVSALPHFGAKLKGSLSIPSFHDNFDKDKQQVTHPELVDQLKSLLASL